jgi:phosphoribosylformylglycinamidine cyclo-ligase
LSLYKESGVDISTASENVDKIKQLARLTHGPRVLSGIGSFSGLFHLDCTGDEGGQVLSAGCDGVGTKVLIAQAMGIHDTVGIDLVAMNVDDVVTSGARPLFFLDYIAVGSKCLESGIVLDLVKGVVEGCQKANCALLGGETAQMPDVYGEGEYDLAGFCVGVANKNEIIDGSTIKSGDVLIGLGSSGLHSNGYSLVRKVLEKAGMNLNDKISDFGRSLGEELLEPTLIYAPSIISISKQVNLKGIAHITGGGLEGNVTRILPKGLGLSVGWNWERPAVFDLIQRVGNIPDQEMKTVFNLGVGMVIIVSPDDADEVSRLIKKSGFKAFFVGEVVTL